MKDLELFQGLCSRRYDEAEIAILDTLKQNSPHGQLTDFEAIAVLNSVIAKIELMQSWKLRSQKNADRIRCQDEADKVSGLTTTNTI